MKKIHIIVVISCLCLVGCVSALSFAADTIIETQQKTRGDELRSDISKKLQEFSRVQNAIDTIEKNDSQEFIDTGFSTQEAAIRAANLGNDIDTVISDIEKLQEKRKENNDNYLATMKQIKKVIIDIKMTKQTITDAVTKMNLYTKRMITIMAKLEETKLYIRNTRETLEKLIPTLYIIQNAYTNQAGNIDDLKLLLGNDESFNSTLTFDDMLQGLSIKLDMILGDLTKAQEQYSATLADMHETRKELKRTALSYHEKIATLEEQRAYLLDFFSLYKGNKVKFDKNINNLFETRKQLIQRIATTVNKANNTMENMVLTDDSIYKEFYLKKDDREKRPNMFSWPVLPIVTIKNFFGDKVSVAGQEETFNGINIPAEQGQELYAPADGVVFYVQDQDSISANWVVLVHKNGYVSVFTNLQKILIKTGDIIDRGQLIGLVGGQPGTRGAGWFGAESMVSMQLFKNGKPIDPLQVMDLSVINNPTILPELYQVKYDTDLRMRSNIIDFTEVKFMEGNTIRERRLKFLDTVAAAPYDDVILWETAAEGTNVDVDLGICIGYAETSMGRHFASENNIGNVGNNDRGDRVDKSSPLDGAKAIYNVLNNQYLGGYRTIYELSGYGNKDGAIYASSEYNWQKNVSRCLSTIKGYIVPEDFPFRTYGELVD